MAVPESPKFFARSVKGLGLTTLYHSPRDVKFLCFQRFVRLVANGACSLILALYLARLGFSDTRIGMFMSLTLIGNVFIALVLTLMADAAGRRNILAVGATLMTGSGVIFGLTSNYWLLLVAAMFGVISPSGNEIGPFRAIEESTLAQLTSFEARSEVFAWYNLIGTLGQALGNITCGWVVHYLQDNQHWDSPRSYRVVFLAYAGLGVLKLLLTLFLSKRCELDWNEDDMSKPTESPTETSPLVPNRNRSPSTRNPEGHIPSMSRASTIVLSKLCILFSIDSIASGLVPQSWISYFFSTKFQLSTSTLGILFFVASIISAFSNLVASVVSRHTGLVKAMVFTNLPSAIMLALVPVPNSPTLAIMFLVLRSCSNSMDNAPRSAFLAAVVLPQERTMAMGIVNVVKTSSQSIGPVITGALVEARLFWVAFVTAGSLKVLYDLGILAVFVNHDTRDPKDRDRETSTDEQIVEDDERIHPS